MIIIFHWRIRIYHFLFQGWFVYFGHEAERVTYFYIYSTLTDLDVLFTYVTLRLHASYISTFSWGY